MSVSFIRRFIEIIRRSTKFILFSHRPTYTYLNSYAESLGVMDLGNLRAVSRAKKIALGLMTKSNDMPEKSSKFRNSFLFVPRFIESPIIYLRTWHA